MVLDPALVSTGALPLELDPTLVLVTDSGLLDAAPAPYQRQAVAAADGNQAFLFYDTSAGQRGVRLVTSEDHWASMRGPSTMVADLGYGDFAAEIFKDDTIYLALPGRDNNLNRLRVYPLRYDPAARTWNPQPPIEVRASSDLSWAGVSVAIERGDGGGSGNYLWVGADERDGNGRWTAKTWHAAVTSDGVGGTWTEATPNFTPATDYRHHGALVAISGGVTLVGRDGTSQRSNSYKRVGGWQGLQKLSDGCANSAEFAGGDPAKRVRVGYDYDAASGLLNRITSPEGSQFAIGYDGLQWVSWIDLPDPSSGAVSTCGRAHCWTFSYRAGAGETTVTDPGGHAWTTTALGSGPVWKLADPTGQVARRTWTATNDLASQSDKLGNRTLYEYDVKGNRLKVIDPLHGPTKPTSYTYTAENRRASMTDARGHTTSYTWTTDGDLDVETDAEGGRVDHDYNNRRELVQVTNARDGLTVLNYDRHGQLERTDRPDGTTVTARRDAWGRPTALVSGVGGQAGHEDHLTALSYDDLGRVTSTRVRMGADPEQDSPDDLVSRVSYDRDGQVTTTTDPRDGVTTLTTDRRGRPVAVVGPPGNGGSGASERPCVTTAYDERGLATETRVAISRVAGSSCGFGASGNTWSTLQRTFDARGLRTEEKLANLQPTEYPGGSLVSSWQYDDNGRVTRATDPRGNYVQLGYDALGRKTSAEAAVTLSGVSGPGCHGITGAVCSTARWEYDEVGNVVREVIPYGSGASQTEATRSYSYDKVQRPLSLTDEVGKLWTTSWDRAGNKLSATNPLAQTSRWEYDALDRVVAQIDPNGNRATTTYTRHGERATATDPNGAVTGYRWDRASRLVEVIDALGQSSRLTLDKGGNRVALTDPNGNTQSATYDALNRLLTVTTPPAHATVCSPTCVTDNVARTATVRWTLDGREQTATDFNGLTKSFSYDSARRLKLLDYGDGTPDVGYSWDKAGNRLAMTENGATTASYQWDELGRLLSETRGTSVLRYGYDRRQQTSVTYPDAKTLVYAFDRAGQLQTLDDWRGSASGRTSYGYDDAGRRTRQTLPSGAVSTWSYDAGGRLSQVEHKPTATGAAFARFGYGYDQAGNRTRQTDYESSRSPAETSQVFEYDGLHRLIRETPRAGIAAVPNALRYDAAGNRKTTSLGQALVEEDPGASVTYGGSWSVDADNRATANEHRRAETNGSWVEFRFSGDAASLTYAALPDGDGGRLRATLNPGTPDEQALGVVDQCSASAAWQTVKTWTGLGDGAHVLRLTREEANRGASRQ